MTKRLGDHTYRRVPGQKKKNGNNKPWAALLGHYMGITSQNASIIAVCGFGGWYLDKKLNTSPVLLICGLFAGAAAGLYYLIRSLKP
ncbi:AtpZ/AtpI family protein [candidate division KSB1 bacterium]